MPLNNQNKAFALAKKGALETLLELIKVDPPLLYATDPNDNTLLLLALKHAHESLSRALLELGAKLNISNKKGMTPLHYAVKRNYFDLVTHMLSFKNGVAINAKNVKGETALMLLADKKGIHKIAEAMWEKPIDASCTNREGRDVFLLAAFYKNVEFCELLIHNRVNINSKDHNGNTALHLAVMLDEREMVDFLLSHNASCLECNELNETVIDIAAKEANIELTNLLRHHHSEPDMEASLFLWAAAKGYLPLLEKLLSTECEVMPLPAVAQIIHTHDVNTFSEPSYREMIKRNDLITTTSNEHSLSDDSSCSLALMQEPVVASAPLLIASQFTPLIDSINVHGDTALMVAVKNNQPKVVDFLMNKNANMEIKNHQEQSAMRLAFNATSPECAVLFYRKIRSLGQVIDHAWLTEKEIKMLTLIETKHYVENPVIVSTKAKDLKGVIALLQNGAEVNDVDKQGQSALYHAAVAGEVNIASCLIQHGANIELKDKLGKRILMAAAYHNQEGMVKLLLSNNAILSYGEPSEKTALELALKKNCIEIASLLYKEMFLLGLAMPNIPEVNLIQDGSLPIGLIEAASTGDVSYAQSLINRGANINACNHKGHTALMSACQHGQVAMMKFLLSQGANTDTLDNEGLTLSHVAALNNQVESLRFLLNLGEDLNQGAGFNKKIRYNGGFSEMTPLHYAAMNGADNALQFLLDKMPKSVNQKTFKEMTPLHHAAESGQGAACQLLMRHGASLISKDARSWTPLESALHDKQLESATVLYNEMTALGIAEPKVNDYKAVHLLYEIRQASNTKNLLMNAVVQNNALEVERVIKRGAEVSFKDKFNQTALFYALQNSAFEVVGVLLAHGADINELCDDGVTYLMSAARDGDLNRVRYLVSMGADLMKINKNGSIALFYALSQGHVEVAKYLVDVCPQSIHHRNKEGWTAIFYAQIKSQHEMVNFLVEQGAEANITSRTGKNMLMSAAEFGDVQMAHDRIAFGDDLMAKDPDGKTALHYAVMGDHFELTKTLIMAMTAKKIPLPKDCKSIKKVSEIEDDIRSFTKYCFSCYRNRAPFDAILHHSQIEFPRSILSLEDKAIIFDLVNRRLDDVFSCQSDVIIYLEKQLSELGAESKVTLKVLVELELIMTQIELEHDVIEPCMIDIKLMQEARNINSGLHQALKTNHKSTFFSDGEGRRRSKSLENVVSIATAKALGEKKVVSTLFQSAAISMLGEQSDTDNEMKLKLIHQLKLNFSDVSHRLFWQSKVRAGGELCDGVKVPKTISKLQHIVKNHAALNYNDFTTCLKNALREEKNIHDNKLFSNKGILRSDEVMQLIRECDNLENIYFHEGVKQIRGMSV